MHDFLKAGLPPTALENPPNPPLTYATAMKIASLRAAFGRSILPIIVGLIAFGQSSLHAGTPPTVTIFEGSYLFVEVGIGSVADVTVNAIFDDPDSSSYSMNWSVVEGIVATPPPVSTGGSGSGHISGVEPFNFTYPLGTFTVIATAVDGEGNQSSASIVLEIGDTIAPVLTATLEGTPVTNGQIIEVDLRDGPVTLEYAAFDFSEITLNKTYTNNTPDLPISANYGTNWIRLNEAPEGAEVFLWAQANDTSYNYSEPLMVTLRVVKKIKDKKDKDKPNR